MSAFGGSARGNDVAQAGRRPRWRAVPSALRFLLAGLALLIATLSPQRAWAQQGGLPSDVGGAWAGPEVTPELPEPPSDYRTETRGKVTWVYPEAASGTANTLQEAFDEGWKRIEDDLGVEVSQQLVIRVGRNPEEMRALAPKGHPPPEYASGVAYPGFGVILLTMSAPDTWQRPNLSQVLTHELSHIALRRAVRGRPLPQWFVEGVAIHQAEEHSLARTRTLWGAAVGDDLIPLSELSASFPRQPHQVNVAYAQSADIVRYLRDEPKDRHRFRMLIKHLREGDSFDQALRNSYFVSVARLEKNWRADVSDRSKALALLFGGGSLWVVASVLLVFAYWRRKRRAKQRLAQMQEEEDTLDRVEETVDEQSAAEQQVASVAVTQDDEEMSPEEHVARVAEDDPERTVVMVSGDPPGGREPDVPTVQHEGREHTLH